MQSEETLARLAGLDREQIETVIHKIHLRQCPAQYEALEQYLAPEAEFEYIGKSPSFPYTRRYIGKKEIVELYKNINTEIELLNCTIIDVIIDGPQAFSRRRVDVRHRGTGVRETHEIWDVWKFRDGMVRESIKLMDFGAYERLQGY